MQETNRTVSSASTEQFPLYNTSLSYYPTLSSSSVPIESHTLVINTGNATHFDLKHCEPRSSH